MSSRQSASFATPPTRPCRCPTPRSGSSPAGATSATAASPCSGATGEGVNRDLRLVPHPVGVNAEFYAFCAAGELRFQRCDECGRWRHPPRFRCGACGSAAWSWERASGRGRLFSWALTHRAIDPAYGDELPYVVAVVELDEGPRLVGNLHGVAPADLALDLPVAAEFEPVADAVALVHFRPARP